MRYAGFRLVGRPTRWQSFRFDRLESSAEPGAGRCRRPSAILRPRRPSKRPHNQFLWMGRQDRRRSWMTWKTVLGLLLGLVTAQSACAQTTASLTPLAPGKPAGVHDAQLLSTTTIFVGSLIIIAGVSLYLASKPYTIPGQPTSSTPSTSP